MLSFLYLFFFYFFISMALISAIMVILNPNPIYSALFLILVFFNSALIILLLDLEFLALVFILIYIGAILVLMLFIIMMLDIKQSIVYLDLSYYFFLSGLFLIFLLIDFLYIITLDFFFQRDFIIDNNYINWFSLVLETSNSKVLGFYLYTYFSFFFLIAGLILLTAMIGAISLTLDKSCNLTSKYQFIYKQVFTKPKNSIFYIK